MPPSAKRTVKHRVSVGDIARKAKLSRTAVGFALQNRPGVSEATRKHVLAIAQELGYSPDPRMDKWMAHVRETKKKDPLPIAWLNTCEEEDAWEKHKFQSPSLEGARERCRQLGYRLEEIWARAPGFTMKRLARILYQRGIEGVLITHPARHVRLNWSKLASVVLGSALLAPRLHRVVPDFRYNLMLAVKTLRRSGYRRIGVCVPELLDRFSQRVVHMMVEQFYHTSPPAERVRPLLQVFNLPDDLRAAEEAIKWLKSTRPEVVVCHDNRMLAWVKEAGLRVPEDIGVAHLAIDDDVLDWTGIHSRRRECAATAVDWLIALIRNRQFGLPATPLDISVRGTWSPGHTVLLPRPKEAHDQES